VKPHASAPAKPALDVDDSGQPIRGRRTERTRPGSQSGSHFDNIQSFCRHRPSRAAGIIYLRVHSSDHTAQATCLWGRPAISICQQQSIVPDAPFDAQQLEANFQVINRGRLRLPSSIDEADRGSRILRLRPPDRSQGCWRPFSHLSPRYVNAETWTPTRWGATAAFADRLTVNRVGVSFVIESASSSRSADTRSTKIANAVAMPTSSISLTPNMRPIVSPPLVAGIACAG